MIYFIFMRRRNLLVIKLAVLAFFLTAIAGEAFPQDHIRELGAIREAMAQVGSALPELIKKSDPKYLRTLERTFEINNYALVTIESYMKMVKVAISSGGTINKDIVTVLNGWLAFIKHYCEYDVKYFDEALAETKDESIAVLLKKEKDNISKLKNVSEKGIEENVKLSKKP